MEKILNLSLLFQFGDYLCNLDNITERINRVSLNQDPCNTESAILRLLIEQETTKRQTLKALESLGEKLLENLHRERMVKIGEEKLRECVATEKYQAVLEAPQLQKVAKLPSDKPSVQSAVSACTASWRHILRPPSAERRGSARISRICETNGLWDHDLRHGIRSAMTRASARCAACA